MKKSIFIIPVFFITAALIIFAISMKGETKNFTLSNFNDSDEVEIYIKIDSIIQDVLNEDFLAALDTIDFEFKELDNIDIMLDSINFEGLEGPGLYLDSLDIELDNLDFELENLDIELNKLKDSLDTKKLIMVIKKEVLDSLKHNMKKMRIVISDNMQTMKDSLKTRMHKMKGELHKDIRIKCLKYRDFKNMTDGEIIESLKEDGVIENENEVEIDRDGDKVIIKITKTKEKQINEY